MSDMRSTPLLQVTWEAHNVWTLSFRVAHMSPSSSGAGVRLSLLEGDCVGPTRPILKAGLLMGPAFFLFAFQFGRFFYDEKEALPLTPKPPPRIIPSMIASS